MLESGLNRRGGDVTSAEELLWKLRETCGHSYGIPKRQQQNVHGRVRLRTHFGVEIADLSGNIQRIERTRKGIRADDLEHVFMLIQQNGITCIEHAG